MINEIQFNQFNTENITIDISGFTGRYFICIVDGLRTAPFTKDCGEIPIVDMMQSGWPSTYYFRAEQDNLYITRTGLEPVSVALINFDNDDVKQSPEVSSGFYNLLQGVSGLSLSGDTGLQTVTVEMTRRKGGKVGFTVAEPITVTGDIWAVHVTGNANFDCMEQVEVDSTDGQLIYLPFIVQGYK